MFDGFASFIDKPPIELHPDPHIARMQFIELQNALRTMTQEGHVHINQSNPKWFYVQACRGLERADQLSEKPIYAEFYAQRTEVQQRESSFLQEMQKDSDKINQPKQPMSSDEEHIDDLAEASVSESEAVQTALSQVSNTEDVRPSDCL